MKIFAIGMNYALHNKEMGRGTDRPNEPVIFTKADSALLKDGKPFFLPEEMGRIDHETELVVRICRLGKSIPVQFAHRYYDAVTLGIDFTARDLQARLKAAGHPWEIAKGFDGSAAIGRWLPVTRFLDLQTVAFHLDVNGEKRQEGNSADMLFRIDEIISYISRFFTLKTGDLLYTGTPAGIAPVRIGDHLEGFIEEEKVLDFYVR